MQWAVREYVLHGKREMLRNYYVIHSMGDQIRNTI